MDYSQSHVVTSEEYLRIMWQKAMEGREVTKQLKENRKKKKKARKKLIMLTAVERLVRRELVNNNKPISFFSFVIINN